MSAQPAGESTSLRARVSLSDDGRANVATGLPVLDRLLELLAVHADGVRSHGSATVPADEALAHVALEVSRRPRVVSNVDLSAEHIGGLSTDLVAGFLNEFAAGAGLTLHVRLIGGSEPEHVLETIFKSLGVALAQAWRSTKKS
jgi:imidazoleglycerol-phosphate dehydratase